MTAPEHTDLIAAAQRMDDMGLSYIELPRLAEPTPASEIKQRPGPHSKWCDKNDVHPPLDYVDARYVMDLLDRVVGPENWQRDHRMAESGKTACGIGINVAGIGWVWKWDGAGETDIEGEKGGFSDSFKRAAVSWGIARDLYDKDRPAAPVQPRRPVAAPNTDLSADEVHGDPRNDEYRETRPAQPRAAVSDGDGRCPVHEQPWTLKPAGKSKSTGKAYDAFYACAFRPARGESFCNEKPSKAWLARHEV